jgi:hypothetical protein
VPRPHDLESLRIGTAGRIASQISPDVIRLTPVANTNSLVVRIGDPVEWGPGADDKASHNGISLIPQEMADWHACLEGRRIAWTYDRMRRTLNNCELALQDIDKLIFGAMPMLYGRTSTGLHLLQKSPEKREAAGLTNPKIAIWRTAIT